MSRTATPSSATLHWATGAKRDTDGDFDGTQVGQADPRDFGKGLKVDRVA